MTGSMLSGVKLALGTIREHKLRAFLTVLGVIMGTGTIIGIGAILAGLDGAVTNMMRSMGSDTLIVFKFKVGVRFGDLTAEERQRKPLTLSNARAIGERCPSVSYVSPFLFPSRGIHKVRYKSADLFGPDIGGTEAGYAGQGVEMHYGRFLSEIDNEHRSKVAVIGEDAHKALFSSLDPLGKFIEIDGHAFEVIGVMKRPATAMPGMSDNRVLLPYFTMRKMFPGADEHMLVVVVWPGHMIEAADEVRAVLRQERRVPYDKPDTFAITSSEQMIADFHRVTSTVALVMVALSSIGLLVGGIGVMNIMLVSVTERTREIGVRKAIGARKADIVIQFLTEAVVLTGLGGLLGMALGWSVAAACRMIFPSLPTMVPAWAPALGFFVSVGVGVFFGLWPASKAASLDPVAALRYE